jgi:uncharacterized protein YecE (DUF72 family)
VAGVRVGTSGWQYDDWGGGAFYPEGLGKTGWLAYYATRFPTVEVNATFYRLARLEAVRRWREQTPAGFQFAVKGSRFVTHNLNLTRPREALRRFFEPLQPLLPVTPLVLWQLPPRWNKNTERLDAFLTALPDGPRYAVEFREASWLAEDVFEVLDRHGAAHVWVSSRTTPADFTPTGGFVYVRFHGLEEGYRYDYSRQELEPWAARLREAAGAGRDAYAYFNNDWEATAPRNAATLVELLGDAAVAWGG